MCGVVGMFMLNPGDSLDMPLFEALMNQSRIRGQHATGVAWFDGKKVQIESQPVGVDKFKYPSGMVKSRMAIGHLRYSTSDLNYNQPIGNDEAAVVHNGVISQEAPGVWNELFGVSCEGKNDTEILFRLWNEADKHPLDLIESSQAVVGIKDGTLHWWRNEQRPLWFATAVDERCVIVASTQDIIKRALVEAEIEGRVLITPTVAAVYYFIQREDGESPAMIWTKHVRAEMEDLQP